MPLFAHVSNINTNGFLGGYTILSQWEFSHVKLGSLSPRKPRGDRGRGGGEGGGGGGVGGGVGCVGLGRSGTNKSAEELTPWDRKKHTVSHPFRQRIESRSFEFEIRRSTTVFQNLHCYQNFCSKYRNELHGRLIEIAYNERD